MRVKLWTATFEQQYYACFSVAELSVNKVKIWPIPSLLQKGENYGEIEPQHWFDLMSRYTLITG